MALLPANPGESMWIGAAGGKNHYNVGIGQGSSGGQNHIDYGMDLIEDGFADALKFYLTADGNTVFAINAGAGKTSTGTAHPRSELRELTASGAKAAWDGRTGEHRMKGRSRIIDVTSNKPWICFFQCHGSDGSPQPSDLFRVQTEGAVGTSTNLSIVCRRSPPGVADEIVTTLRTGYDLNDWVSWECAIGGPTSADNGRLRIWLDGELVLNVTGMGQILCYWKMGCYLQDNVEKGASASDYAAVEVERGSFQTWHTGYPPPTVPVFTGGSDGSGGVDSQAPTIPGDVVAVRDSTQITLSWQESSDNVGVDHYNISRTGPGGGSSTSTTTMGKLTDGASTSLSSADKTAVSSVVASATGTLTGAHIRAWLSAPGTSNTKAVVYSNSAGLPLTKLAESDVIALTATAEAEVDYVFSGANLITITSGVTYWIGLAWQDPGTPSLTISRDGTASARQETSSYAPGTFSSPSAQSGPIDCYIDVEVTTAATTTIGKTDTGDASTTSSADKMVASVATSDTSGTLTEGHARLWLSSAGSTNAKMVVYADSGGAPGAKLATSDQVAISNTTTADTTFAFTGGQQIALTASTDYWIAVTWGDPGSPSITYSRASDVGKRLERSDITYGTPPDPWGTSTFTGAGPIDAWLVAASAGEGTSLVATTTSTSYVDTGLTNGVEYTYQISAEDAAGNVSPLSDAVAQTPGAPDTTAPTVPTGLDAVAGDGRVTITWNASTDADSGVDVYRLHRGGTLIVETDLLTYTDTAVTNGTLYAYTISAVDVAGNESAQSSADNATPSAPSIGGVALFPHELGADARMQVQIAFGADLAADPSTWTWTDVTTDVRQDPGISCSLGRGDESSRSNPATFTCVLGNSTGAYSLGGRSTHYPYVRRGTPVRWRVDPADAAGARILFTGNADGFTPGYGSLSLTGSTRTVTLSASGTLRRLGQGDAPLQSAYRRAMTADETVVAYWPLEEGKDATIAPAVRGGTELAIIAGAPDWASNSDFDCSAELPAVRTGYLSAGVDPYTDTGENEVRWLLSIPPDGITDGVALCHISMTGNLSRWDITYETGDAGPGLGIYRWNDDGTRQGDITITPLPLNGKASRISLQVSQSGSDIVWQIGLVESFYGAGSLSAGGTIPSKTCGIVRQIEINPHGTGGDMAVGHVTVSSTVASLFTATDALVAHEGEFPTTSGSRLVRLCRENGVALTRYGATGESAYETERMGPQLVDTLLNLAYECEDADQGQIWDGRDPGLSVTTRRYRENGNLGLTIDVASADLAPGFAPTHDDQRTRNRWQITRLQGATAVHEDEDGPLGTEVIGEYSDSATINTRLDAQALQHAAWRVHLGTVEGYRFPTVVLDARAAPDLVPDALDIIPGGRIDLTGIADDAAPLTGRTVSLIVEGIDHEMDASSWLITFRCSLFSPWGVGKLAAETGDTSALVMRLDTDGSTLASTASASATSLSVATTGAGALWTTASDDYPLWLSVGGLPVRATACSGSSSPQTFTVDALPVARASASVVALWDPRPVGIG